MAVTYLRGFIAGDTGATLCTWGLRNCNACHQYIGTSCAARSRTHLPQHLPASSVVLRHTGFGQAWETLVLFFLVDPEVESVVGTAEVAQRREWAHRVVDEAVDLRRW